MPHHRPLLGSVLLAAIAGCAERPAPPRPATGSIPSAPPALAPVPLADFDPRPGFEADVAPVLDRFCVECHAAAAPKARIALDGPDPDLVSLTTWDRVAGALGAGTMPPPGRPRPDPGELAALDRWIGATLDHAESRDLESARATMRRLSRAEYDNTLRDLIGLDPGLAAAFPADDVGYGFDRIGDVLSISPVFMERHLEAADRAIEAVARSPKLWARIMDPPADAIPPALRKPTFAVRSDPVKRIGRPQSVPPPTPAEVAERRALQQTREVLRAFADRAYRRPATAAELDRLAGLVEGAQRAGDDRDEAIRTALKAILVAPSFLFLVEERDEAGRPQQPGDFELASRLSYFLWSGPPDDELYRLAVGGQLRRAGVLAGQARRMLRDPKARALIDGFVAQWLQVGTLRDCTPDPARFPAFDEALCRSMTQETLRLGEAIVREDRPLRDFLDADFTYLDERLARHYGIAGVVGDQFRRVSLVGTPRRGVLNHASILTITANPTGTSPVRRGRWVLDNLLGAPPAPPPDGVASFADGSHEGRGMTARQRLERHRADPSCRSCHARLDPLGFALENFDGIGAWREADAGRPLDVRGELPDGSSFLGPAGLRAELVARGDAFARCLAEKLLIYALGRGLRPTDRPAVDAITDQLERGEVRFSTLVAAIVESRPFRGRPLGKDGP